MRGREEVKDVGLVIDVCMLTRMLWGMGHDKECERVAAKLWEVYAVDEERERYQAGRRAFEQARASRANAARETIGMGTGGEGNGTGTENVRGGPVRLTKWKKLIRSLGKKRRASSLYQRTYSS